MPAVALWLCGSNGQPLWIGGDKETDALFALYQSLRRQLIIRRLHGVLRNPQLVEHAHWWQTTPGATLSVVICSFTAPTI